MALREFGTKGLMFLHVQPKHLVVPTTIVCACIPICFSSQHSIYLKSARDDVNYRMMVERVTGTKWNGLRFDSGFRNV